MDVDVDTCAAVTRVGVDTPGDDGGGEEGAAAAAVPSAAFRDAATEIGALANTLLWRHLAPTAPDTLACFPATEADPFALGGGGGVSPLPDLLFSGNASAFGTAVIGGTRVVTVPSFATTRTVVLVNLTSPTLEVQPVTFQVGVLNTTTS